MPHDTDQPNQLTATARIQANLSLAFLKGLSILPTQPIQVMMRWQQAMMASKTDPRALSALEAAREIYYGTPKKPVLNPSLLKFFNGGMAGAWKELLKSGLYKGFFITEAPMHADTVLRAANIPDYMSPTCYFILKSTLAGTGAALADTAISGPIEGWATYRSTSQGENANANFWKEVFAQKTLTGKISRAYQGAGAATAKTAMAMSTFFCVADSIKTFVAQTLDIPDKKNMPWYGSITSALMTGGLVAFVSSVFDIRKTQRQMPDAVKNSMLQSLMNDYRRFGVKGPLAGVPLKFLMIAIGWGITDIATQPGPFQTWVKGIFKPVSASEFASTTQVESCHVGKHPQGFFGSQPQAPSRVMSSEEEQTPDAPSCFP